MKFDKNFYKNWVFDWRVYVAEFVATFIFIFVCALATIVDYLHGQIGLLGISAVVGSTYAALIFATNHHSGGFLNPAVTFSLWLGSKLNGVKTIFLIVAQLLASLVAYGTVLLLFGQNATRVNLGAPILGIGETIVQAMTLEAILSAIFVFCVYAVMVDRRGPVSFGPLVLGLVLTASTIVSLPLTGAALNPSRVFGAYAIGESFSFLVPWILGPLMGSFAGLLYQLVFLTTAKVRK